MLIFLALAGHVVEIDAVRPVRTVDPRTGRTRIDLGGWHRIDGSPDESERPAVLSSPVPEGSRLGLLETGASAVRSLGRVPHRVDDCAADAGTLVCRAGPTELRLWRYR